MIRSLTPILIVGAWLCAGSALALWRNKISPTTLIFLCAAAGAIVFPLLGT